MAFAFFRRRQKMVIIVMAVLMVSFLVGFQGFDMLFSRGGPEKRVLGKVYDEEIRYADLAMAEADLTILNNYLGLGDPRNFGAPFNQELICLQQDSRKRDLAYVLLLREAQKSGLRVADNEVEDFLTQIGVAGARRQLLLDAMRNNLRVNEPRFLVAVGRWLLIHKNSVASFPSTPPTDQELRRLFADLVEQLTLRVVQIPAERFLKNIPEPGLPEVLNQFRMYKSVLPGHYSNAASFGFGYYQPAKVKIAYLSVNEKSIRRTVQPDEKSVREYYLTNRAEFVRQVPVEAQSKPASTQASSQPSTKPVEYRSEQIDFATAKPMIIEKLTEEAAVAKMDEMATKAETLRQEVGKSTPEVFEAVVGKMRLPADEILKRTVDVRIEAQRLDRAMAMLAEAAHLNAIVYPYGGQGLQKIDPGVRVSLVANGLSLRNALNEISGQVKWVKELNWAGCLGMEGTLFPVDSPLAEGFFPVSAGMTGLVDYPALAKDNVLGRASESPEGGRRLPDVVFGAAFGGEKGPTLRSGEDGQRMFGTGENTGRILWRLSEAVPAHEPGDLTDEIREQVVMDLRTKAAFDKATELATKVKQMAARLGLEEAARSNSLEFDQVETITRKSISMPAMQMLSFASQLGRPDLLMRATMLPPISFDWRTLSEMELPVELRQDLMEKVFSLVPADKEASAFRPSTQPRAATGPASKPVASQPAGARAVEFVSLPSIRTVAVLERLGYRPPVIGEYVEGKPNSYPPISRDDLIRYTIRQWQWSFTMKWFNAAYIEKRTGYVEETAK